MSQRVEWNVVEVSTINTPWPMKNKPKKEHIYSHFQPHHLIALYPYPYRPISLSLSPYTLILILILPINFTVFADFRSFALPKWRNFNVIHGFTHQKLNLRWFYFSTHYATFLLWGSLLMYRLTSVPEVHFAQPRTMVPEHSLLCT